MSGGVRNVVGHRQGGELREDVGSLGPTPGGEHGSTDGSNA